MSHLVCHAANDCTAKHSFLACVQCNKLVDGFKMYMQCPCTNCTSDNAFAPAAVKPPSTLVLMLLRDTVQ